jgi:hypothetical protein
MPIQVSQVAVEMINPGLVLPELDGVKPAERLIEEALTKKKQR